MDIFVSIQIALCKACHCLGLFCIFEQQKKNLFVNQARLSYNPQAGVLYNLGTHVKKV
jgi:hypothetical protein